jgi:hypothetical protein
LVEDRNRSREFIAFLKLIDAAYPSHTAIRLILDNHNISKETKAWLANPEHWWTGDDRRRGTSKSIISLLERRRSWIVA